MRFFFSFDLLSPFSLISLIALPILSQRNEMLNDIELVSIFLRRFYPLHFICGFDFWMQRNFVCGIFFYISHLRSTIGERDRFDVFTACMLNGNKLATRHQQKRGKNRARNVAQIINSLRLCLRIYRAECLEI